MEIISQIYPLNHRNYEANICQNINEQAFSRDQQLPASVATPELIPWSAVSARTPQQTDCSTFVRATSESETPDAVSQFCFSVSTMSSDAVLLLETVNFAAEKHRYQRRKDPDRTPYINHPVGT